MKSRSSDLKPFTLEHFREWAKKLTLDNGEPWILEPFQERFIEDVFSGKPVSWLIIPEGNGKTTLIAGLALYWIEHRQNAKVFVAAASRDQATDNCFGQMNVFVVASDLEKVFTCQEGHRRVLCRGTNSRIQIRAADERTGDGLVSNLIIVDELHRHKDLALYRTWRGKLKKRNGQMIVISTAGEPGSEFEQNRDRMRQNAEETEREETFTRSVGESHVLHDWSVPEDGDADDLELVAKANPLSLITAETLREERESPDWNFGHWRRMKCNLPTRSELAAITEAEWFAAEVEEDIPEGELVDLGIDIGWKYDTTALQPIWIPDPEYRLLGIGKVIAPPGTGEQTHPDKIKNAVLEIHKRTPLRSVVMDTSNAMDLYSWLEDELGIPVVDRQQSNAFHCNDYKVFMEALRQGFLKHTREENLTRHALNAIARPATYGDLRFDRPVASRLDRNKQDMRVIDALTAAAMVHTSAAAEMGSGEPLVMAL